MGSFRRMAHFFRVPSRNASRHSTKSDGGLLPLSSHLYLPLRSSSCRLSALRSPFILLPTFHFPLSTFLPTVPLSESDVQREHTETRAPTWRCNRVGRDAPRSRRRRNQRLQPAFPSVVAAVANRGPPPNSASRPIPPIRPICPIPPLYPPRFSPRRPFPLPALALLSSGVGRRNHHHACTQDQ
jgi:hypothetical protein